MSKGLFFDLQKKKVKPKKQSKGKDFSCASCGMHQQVKTPYMKPFGNFKKGILNIGEAPGETEDMRGKPWQGKAGRLLQRAYKQLGIDLFDDCLNINAVSCRPTDKKGNNRTPTPFEIACCRTRVFETIRQYKPKVIIALGNSPIISLLGNRWKKNLGGITKWRGWTIPDRDLHAWLCPTFHPSFISRMDTDEAFTIWEQDLTAAFAMLDKPFPEFTDDTKYVHIIDNPDKLPSFPNMVAFDFETTGIKPYAKGHRIVSASVAYNEKEVYSFLMPHSPAGRTRFIALLKNPNIKKIAHNMKFEETWSKIRLKQSVQGWYWDTMLAAHILDNRPGIGSLKFQTYLLEGVVDYDSEISPYLKGIDSKDTNSLNRIMELVEDPVNREKLLTYNGLDSLYTFRLMQGQRRLMYGNAS